jgi:hypothetical protein
VLTAAPPVCWAEEGEGVSVPLPALWVLTSLAGRPLRRSCAPRGAQCGSDTHLDGAWQQVQSRPVLVSAQAGAVSKRRVRACVNKTPVKRQATQQAHHCALVERAQPDGGGVCHDLQLWRGLLEGPAPVRWH